MQGQSLARGLGDQSQIVTAWWLSLNVIQGMECVCGVGKALEPGCKELL